MKPANKCDARVWGSDCSLPRWGNQISVAKFFASDLKTLRYFWCLIYLSNIPLKGTPSIGVGFDWMNHLNFQEPGRSNEGAPLTIQLAQLPSIKSSMSAEFAKLPCLAVFGTNDDAYREEQLRMKSRLGWSESLCAPFSFFCPAWYCKRTVQIEYNIYIKM
jgi:hypothetical protein